MSNQTFSFMFIQDNKLKSFNEINSQSIICSLDSTQKYQQQEIYSLTSKLKKQINFFNNIYQTQIRNKRDNFLNEFLSKSLFSDSDDLQSIHSVLNNFITQNNKQTFIEKTIFQELQKMNNK